MNKGFSLIEIMITVAIVAIVTALSIPLYNTYSLSAKIDSARPFLETYFTQIKNYYTDHGSFPTNVLLGVSSTVPTSVAGYLSAPYIAYITIVPQTTSGTQCQYVIATAYFSNYAGDHYANSALPYIALKNYYIDKKGTLVSMCSYAEFNAVTTTSIFRDCTTDAAIMNVVNTACV